MVKRHFVAPLISENDIARHHLVCHLERISVETELLRDLKIRNSQGSEDFGTPCHSVWVKESHERRV
jgi:hypothetical protein